MVKSKTELFEPEVQKIAEIFKALSHPARISILKYLAETKTCITGDISRELPLGRSTVNQHLSELKIAGFIQGHIEGANTKYCLQPGRIKEMKRIADEFFQRIDLEDNYSC